MSHVDMQQILRCVALICCAIAVYSERRKGRFQGDTFVVLRVGFLLSAVGLVLGFAGI